MNLSKSNTNFIIERLRFLGIGINITAHFKFIFNA